jgi:magnesium-transporting ATPase (P-type)
LNLHEDLAEVEYIFADKTGTLTQNELVFREMAILNEEDLILIQNPDQKDRKQINLKKYPAAQDFFTCLSVC